MTEATKSPVPWQSCPWCGHSIGGGTHMGPPLPRVGDLAVSACCGRPLRVAENFQVARLTPAEFMALDPKERDTLAMTVWRWLMDPAVRQTGSGDA